MPRFVDRPSHTVSLTIAAPAAVVWPVLVDLPRFGEWSPENRGGEWLDGATLPAVGVRFKGRQEHPVVGQWETVSTVTECDPPRRFTWVVGDGAATWSFELSGATEVRFTAIMGPGPSGASAAIERMPDKEERIIERRLQEWEVGMRAVLEGVKFAVEGA